MRGNQTKLENKLGMKTKLICTIVAGALTAGMLRPATAALAPDTNIVLRLTESVRSNLWMSDLHSELVRLPIPVTGSNIHLTVDPALQEEAVSALKWGLGEFDAAEGWAIVMDAKTGAIYAIVSYPEHFGSNHAITLNYEPGAVMMVIAAAAALDSNPKRYEPEVRISTNRQDPNYYRLPGDGSHMWEPTMSLTEAVCRSCNIVMGKVSYDLGPYTMHTYLRLFGFGSKTGIELPGEQSGILPDPVKWDTTSWSRTGVGQYVAVTSIQIASAYQTIANDGVRMRPYIIDRIVDDGGTELVKRKPVEIRRVISADTARKLRQMMTGVVTTNGTAHRAAIRGYSVAGKTGTAQKRDVKGYSSSQYYATFCGIVPACHPRLVILTALDFDHSTKFHQGGNSAGPVFRRIALAAIRCLGVQPDKPDELDGQKTDESVKFRVEGPVLPVSKTPR